MDFFVRNDKKHKVRTASPWISHGSLIIDWSVQAFGGGQFYLYSKGDMIKCANEMCGLSTITPIFQKAFWDMTYTDFEKQECEETSIDLLEVRDIFVTKEGGCRILYNFHSINIDDCIATFSILIENNQREIIFSVPLDKLPDLSDIDNRALDLSMYLCDGIWDTSLSVKQKKWSKKSIVNSLNTTAYPKEITETKMFSLDNSIVIAWKNPIEAGELLISQSLDTPGCNIKTQGRDRYFVNKIVEKLLHSAELED